VKLRAPGDHSHAQIVGGGVIFSTICEEIKHPP